MDELAIGLVAFFLFGSLAAVSSFLLLHLLLGLSVASSAMAALPFGAVIGYLTARSDRGMKVAKKIWDIVLVISIWT